MKSLNASPSLSLLRATAIATLFALPLAAQAQNTAYGTGTLSHNKGTNNSAFGYEDLFYNTTGFDNTAIGCLALFSNTTGSYNTATGYLSLYFNTAGVYNTANGYNALLHNTTGGYNTADGVQALWQNTTGLWNTAIGVNALYANTIGSNNVGMGGNCLVLNTSGIQNTVVGNYAMYNNTTGGNNAGYGLSALGSNTTGSGNVANGYQALYNNKTGNNNIALGSGAGFLTTGSNNIDISNSGVAAESGVTRIGTTGAQTAAFIAGISGVTASGGVAVYIDANGQLGTLTSSRRFKRDIHDMGTLSDKLMKLRPVTFRYKDSAEKGTHALQYGLIAEEVAKVYPDLVQYDKQGKPFTVYYHLLTPMLLNALQKEHRQNVAMNLAHKAEIAGLKQSLNSKIAAIEVAHKAEIAELKQSLGKLAAYLESTQNRAPLQKAVFVQH